MKNVTRWALVAAMSVGASAAAHAGSAPAEPQQSSQGQRGSGSATQKKPGADACPMDDAARTRAVLRQLHAINQDEMKLGKLASDKGQATEVKQFGARMLKDHADVDAKLGDLAKAQSFSLEMGALVDPVHAALDAAGKELERSLSGKSGAEFDASYLGPQVLDHDVALKVIEEGQRFAASNADAKKLLDETHKVVTEHRDEAARLLDRMRFQPSGVGGGPSGAGDAGVAPHERMNPPERNAPPEGIAPPRERTTPEPTPPEQKK